MVSSRSVLRSIKVRVNKRQARLQDRSIADSVDVSARAPTRLHFCVSLQSTTLPFFPVSASSPAPSRISASLFVDVSKPGGMKAAGASKGGSRGAPEHKQVPGTQVGS